MGTSFTVLGCFQDNEFALFCSQCEDQNLLHQTGCKFCHRCGSLLKVRSGSRIFCEEFGGESFDNAYSDDSTDFKKIIRKRLPYSVSLVPAKLENNHDESESSAFPFFFSNGDPYRQSKYKEQFYSITTGAVMTKESKPFTSNNMDSQPPSDPLNMPEITIRKRRQISLAQNFNLEELHEDFIAALREKVGISNLEDLLVATQDDIDEISRKLGLSLAEKLRFRRSVLTEQRLLSISNSLRRNSYHRQRSYSVIEGYLDKTKFVKTTRGESDTEDVSVSEV